jgi:hypothetical protein
MRFPLGFLLLLTAATLAVVRPCSAQHGIEITPFVGAYLPGADSRVTASTDMGVDVNTIYGTEVGQDNAVVGGVRLTAWFSRRFATEVSVAYSPSGTASRAYDCWHSFNFGGSDYCSSATVTDKSSRVVTGSARVLFAPLSPPTQRHPSLYVVAGIGVFHRSGPGFQAAEQTAGTAVPSTDWGPVVGVGARVPVTSTLAYRAELVLAERGWDYRHGDFVFSLGLSKTLVGRAPSVQAQN